MAICGKKFTLTAGWTYRTGMFEIIWKIVQHPCPFPCSIHVLFYCTSYDLRTIEKQGNTGGNKGIVKGKVDVTWIKGGLDVDFTWS
ncbi:hypothetical protein GCM10023231_04490 [Olivibacter ginsenosidimutans]|uniref:Uncharacterized protein n=1 Tax=Olivibacter ginsenosidimutans TaxID=1176537 RepID=A0ABP9AF37_9SPHI